jgi:hypothetical protein
LHEKFLIFQKFQFLLDVLIYFSVALFTSFIPSPQRQAKACVQECHPQKLFTDSKYLREESLTELVQWLIQLSSGPHAHAKNKTEYSEYSSAVFIGVLKN